MTTTVKFTNSTAAGAEIDRRAERHMAEHGCGYREAWHAVLAADPELARAYAMPAATATKKPTPAVPVTADDEQEILDWVLRAVRDGHPGALPGALGQLSIEADTFAKLGMPIEEAARRAMDGNPHLVAMAKLLLADVRRNAPGSADKAPPPELAQGTPGEIAHSRAQALTDKHPHLSYDAAPFPSTWTHGDLHIGKITSDGAALISFRLAPNEIPLHPPETAGERLVEYLLR